MRWHLSYLCMMALAIGAATNGSSDEIPSDAGSKIGLDELVRRVQQRDPELAALHREILAVGAAGERDLRARDPQIRLGYSSTSHSAVPDPYTEVREETITATESRSELSTTSGSENGTERRTDRSPTGDASERRTSTSSFTVQDREAGSSQSTTTRTTVREVTPDRRSTSIRETVYETGRESFNESATRTESVSGSETRVPATPGEATRFSVGGSSDRSRSARGSEQTRVSEQHVEERSYSTDPYEGADDYSIQLRFYPRNPLEKRARKGQSEADTSIAEYQAGTRNAEIRQEVRASFIELQFFHRELQLLDRRIDALNRDVTLQEDLYEAGRVGLDKYADSRVDAIDARLDRDALRVEADALRDGLAARAGLADSTRIDLSDEIEITKAASHDLDRDRLVDAAWQNRRELGILEEQDGRLAQDLALVRGGRMPWLSLLSGEYTYQERHGGKYRDEYSVVAGFTVPVFRWFRNEGALITQSRESISRDTQILREQIELDVTHALRQLEQSRSDLDAYAAEHLGFRKKIQSALAALPADTPTARGQRAELGRILVVLQTRELGLTRAYARAVLRLEEILGTPLDEAHGRATGAARQEADHEG